MSFDEKIEKLSPAAVVLLSVCLLAAVGFIDHLTGVEISFSIFYLLPISLIAWRLNLKWGTIFSIIGASTWYFVDRLGIPNYSSGLVPLWNALVRFGFFIVISMAISRLRLSLNAERALSRTDHLTGVSNTRHFYQLAEAEIARALRYGHPFSVAYMDIDNFKIINDGFGHLAGDALLVSVARIMKNNFRSIDIIARLGGDEFIMLLPETGNEAAHIIMNKIQSLLGAEMQKDGWPVSFSIGVITFGKPPQTVDELIKKADDVMYFVKASGKNQIVYNEIN